MQSIVGGLFGPDCGEFNPTSAAQGYFEYTQKEYPDKIEIRLKSEVDKIIYEDNEVKGVKLTNGEELFADKVVLAAGAYSTKIMEQSGFEGDDLIPMVPWKRMLFVVKMPPIEGFDNIPMTIIDNGVYFRPEAGNLLVGKANNDQEFGFYFDPEPDYYEEEMNTFMQARIPGTEYCRIVSSQSQWGGLYAHNKEDKNAIIGKHISVENLYLATAFSGHGAMEAPAAGVSMAEIIMNGKPETIPEVEQLSMTRFREGKLIKETIVI
jgi:sarcosine oxidase subunit beta